MASLFSRFLDLTQRRTTISRTPVGEQSARLRDHFLTTRQNATITTNTHDAGGIQTHKQTYTLGRAPTGTDRVLNTLYKNDKYNNNNNELRHCYCYKVKFARVLNSAFAKLV